MPAAIVKASPSTKTWTKDDWNSPPWILDVVYEFNKGPIGLDPASNKTSLVDSYVQYFEWDNGLILPWTGHGLVWVNPPYSRGLFLKFCEKAYAEAEAGAEIIMLVPANVETKAWHKYLWKCDAVCFPSKRVKFLVDGKPKGSPQFGSALVYFGLRRNVFKEVFAKLGAVR